MNEYIDMWRNFANFSGRTSRRGYWMAVLVNFVVSTVIGLVAGWIGLGIISTVYTYVVFIPGLSICVRRLRDADCHWINLFWVLLPIIGSIILIVKLCKPGRQVYAVPENSYEPYEY